MEATGEVSLFYKRYSADDLVLRLEIIEIDPCSSFSGAASSGDIDILLTHPNYTSETEKQVWL